MKIDLLITIAFVEIFSTFFEFLKDDNQIWRDSNCAEKAADGLTIQRVKKKGTRRVIGY